MLKFITNKSVKRKWRGQLVLGEPDASPPSRISDGGSLVLGGSATSGLREDHRSWEGRRNSVLTEVGGCAGNDKQCTHEFSEAMAICTRLGPSTFLMDGGGTSEAPLLPL